MTSGYETPTATEFSEWMDANGFDREKLAERLGCSASGVRKWMSGERPLDYMTWLACQYVALHPRSPRTTPSGEEFAAWMKEQSFENYTLAAALDARPSSIWKWRVGKHPLKIVRWLACLYVAGGEKDRNARKNAAKKIADARRQVSTAYQDARRTAARV